MQNNFLKITGRVIAKFNCKKQAEKNAIQEWLTN